MTWVFGAHDMTEQDALRLLSMPSTRKLVFEALKLAETRDILDAAEDLRTASDILYARFDAMRKKHDITLSVD